jgi:magnesium transporter
LDDDQQIRIITSLHPSDSANVLEKLEDQEAVKIAEKLPHDQLADILDEMKSDEAADVVSELKSDQIALVLEEMEDPDEIIGLLQYPSDTAGGLMTVVEVTLKPDLTVSESLSIIRRGEKLSDNTYYLFVTDEDSYLIGVVGLHDLIYSPSGALIEGVMESNVISVAVTSHEEEFTQIMAHYGFLSLPVVDTLGKLVGVITGDDIFEVSRNKATKDMYGLAGITGEERLLGPIRESVIKRLPWLAINVLTLFIAISVIDAFEAVIAGTVALAIFLPIFCYFFIILVFFSSFS